MSYYTTISPIFKISFRNALRKNMIRGLKKMESKIIYLLQSFSTVIRCSITGTWASLVGQLIKNPPIMWETWARSLG